MGLIANFQHEFIPGFFSQNGFIIMKRSFQKSINFQKVLQLMKAKTYVIVIEQLLKCQKKSMLNETKLVFILTFNSNIKYW